MPCLSQVLHCQLSAEEVMFPVSVTQQSPAAVSMETYHITLTLPPTQVEGVWEMELGSRWFNCLCLFSWAPF